MTNNDIVWHAASVGRAERESKNSHKGTLLWFTGLSGSGKSTVANALARTLWDAGHFVYVLDGDNVRHGLNRDLGFTENDRKENIRRISEVAKLFVDAGAIVITAFISPYREDRSRARSIMETGDFYEVFIDCPLEECENRDVKGLYKRARQGEIPNFTGISSPYEAPEHADITVQTAEQTVEESVESIIAKLKELQIIKG